MNTTKGSVTVSFALVFVILFSFILSFFEMASHVARASYHAAAALLATENYFGEYVRPLYEEYHIFAREESEGDKIVARAEEIIGADVAYMTEKREGERSLLLRSGAEFEVTEAKTLTSDAAAGFYRQAVTAMKYRGALEVAQLLKDFSGMTEQAEKNLEVAAAKAEADHAYGKVEERILHLIGLIDGVDIVQYEKFLDGKGVLFQKDAYVKYFCTTPAMASEYFDRAEVYQAFSENSENPCDTLENLIVQAEYLADEIELRRADEAVCRSELARLRGKKAVTKTEKERIKEDLKEVKEQYRSVVFEIGVLTLSGNKPSELAELLLQEEELESAKKMLEEEETRLEDEEKALEIEIKEWEKEEKRLERLEKNHKKSVKSLVKEETAFLEQAEKVRGICEEAYAYVEEIEKEVKIAAKAKSTCETVLDAAQWVVGEETVNAYREDLKAYEVYEDLGDYNFPEMKQTLLENKSVLWNIKKQDVREDATALRNAAENWRSNKTVVQNYSFAGLKLDYGEMSLAGDLYDGVESLVSKEVADGFLGFLTEKEVSEKVLDTSELSSGFSYEDDDSFSVFSLLGTDMSGILDEMQGLLPEGSNVSTAIGGITDPILFQSYLFTHFSNYLEENPEGALSYELEYLVGGKDSDEENLSAVAMRLCVIRTVLHFVSLYSDSERKAPVEQAALAACGAIGLPALKSIAVFLLLFVWALEEAMIDTAAFLQGKKLLLYPGKNGGSLTFPDILRFSKSFILEMAEKKENAKGLVLGYHEFLHLFVFLTPKGEKSYRALDLMQENMRKAYGDSFRINRCVWKISYRVNGKEYTYAYE